MDVGQRLKKTTVGQTLSRHSFAPGVAATRHLLDEWDRCRVSENSLGRPLRNLVRRVREAGNQSWLSNRYGMSSLQNKSSWRLCCRASNPFTRDERHLRNHGCDVLVQGSSLENIAS